MPKVTLESIASKMGVSTVAVFKALNDEKGVSDDLRKKIKAYAKTVGYESKASRLGINKKKFLFFIKQDFFLTPSEQFYSMIFYYLNTECSQTNSTLQVAFIEPEHTLEKIKAKIAAFDPDGIFLASEVSAEILAYFEPLPIPTVFIDYFSPLFSCNYVYVDNFQVSYMLTKYLINKGHRRIGFVGDISKTGAIADRYFGYLKALNEEKLSYAKEWHINENIERSNDIVPLPALTSMPTAYICHCDSAAQRLYTLLAMKGLHVPSEVSVVSFDNNSLCDILMPKLTSIGPHKDSYAKRAFAVMVDALKNKHTNIQIKSHLVERDSVRPI